MAVYVFRIPPLGGGGGNQGGLDHIYQLPGTSSGTFFVGFLLTLNVSHVSKHFRDINWRYLYRLYGYGLCKGKPTPKIAENKVLGTCFLGI